MKNLFIGLSLVLSLNHSPAYDWNGSRGTLPGSTVYGSADDPNWDVEKEQRYRAEYEEHHGISFYLGQDEYVKARMHGLSPDDAVRITVRDKEEYERNQQIVKNNRNSAARSTLLSLPVSYNLEHERRVKLTPRLGPINNEVDGSIANIGMQTLLSLLKNLSGKKHGFTLELSGPNVEVAFPGSALMLD